MIGFPHSRPEQLCDRKPYSVSCTEESMIKTTWRTPSWVYTLEQELGVTGRFGIWRFCGFGLGLSLFECGERLFFDSGPAKHQQTTTSLGSNIGEANRERHRPAFSNPFVLVSSGLSPSAECFTSSFACLKRCPDTSNLWYMRP